MATLTKRDWAEKASTFHAFAQAGLGIIQTLTQVTSKDIASLKNALNGKRLIVIIDDLDRVDPALIPRLFMSLRDVMDLEGFSFLLLFDGQMVSDALGQQNRALGYGEKFLDKILDYRVYLVPATEEQVAVFFRHELQQNCSFINTDVLSGLDKYLPTNPRKLKSLVRSLRIFQTEGERHKADEIDWQAVIFAQMIKMESEPFFRLFEENTFGKRENRNPVDVSPSNPWMLAAIEKDKEKAQ